METEQGFRKRLSQGQVAELQAAAIFRARGYEVRRTGSEHMAKNNWSMPDFQLSNPKDGKQCWVEVKADDAISQRSYEFCKSMNDKGDTVYLMVRMNNSAFAVLPVDGVVWHERTPSWITGSGGSGQPWRAVDLQKSKVAVTIPIVE